jgi:hypothetical protein
MYYASCKYSADHATSGILLSNEGVLKQTEITKEWTLQLHEAKNGYAFVYK